MKRSIIVAFLILAGVVGWLGSGQITNVNAQDEENSNTTENKDTNSYKSDDNSNENEELVFSVETKIFKASLIDQSIELQGQSIHNKKIDVKSETSGNISKINFSRGDKVNKNSGSMGVAFSSCTVPAAGKPTFDLGVDEMEFGVGIHGEPGRRRDKVKPAQEITNELLEAIIEDLKPENNEEILLFVNGMGGTPLTELYLVYDNAKKMLDGKKVKIARSLVGNYCTSLEMQGASITLTKLDQELVNHWDSAVHTAAMRWGM